MTNSEIPGSDMDQIDGFEQGDWIPKEAPTPQRESGITPSALEEQRGGFMLLDL